jgi:tellurite resistance protein TerB
MFGKFFNKAKNEVAAFKNADLMQAAVAAGVLVAYADGDCSDEEVDTLMNVLGSSPALAPFKDKIAENFEKYSQLMEASKRMGTRDLMKEIEDCKHDDTEAETVLIVALDVADADGDDPKEAIVLEKIAKALGLKIEDYA